MSVVLTFVFARWQHYSPRGFETPIAACSCWSCCHCG